MSSALLRFLLLAACLAGCTRVETQRPNVLLITVDTLRPDRLSCYGYDKDRTPNIDWLAEAGVLFQNAFCDVTWTTPSMASVMTGEYANIHGLKSTAIHRLAPERLTLAEVLKQAGYQTAAVVGSFPLHSVYQLDQGFDSYDDYRPRGKMPWRSDATVTRIATRWLRQHAKAPFFFWVHYFGPHDKPDMSLGVVQGWRRHVNGYDADVVRTDGEVGRLLAALDELDLSRDTLVVFHADHGESLFEHGHVGHGNQLYDTTLRIPLIMRYPGHIPAGVRVRAMARNVDIFPTVLELTGLSADTVLSGRSLLPLIENPLERPLVEETYAETYMPAHEFFAESVQMPDGSKRKVGLIRRGVRHGRWMFIRTEPFPMFGDKHETPEVPKEVLESLRKEELYDTVRDPGEVWNQVERQPEVAARMRQRLRQYLQQNRSAEPVPTVRFDDETRSRLRDLGYGRE